MRTWIALTAVAASGLLVGCRRGSVRHSDLEPVGPVCSGNRCLGIGAAGPQRIVGGTTIAVLSFASPCRFDASWAMGEAGEASFHATMDVRVGEVFAARGYVVQVDACDDVRRIGNRHAPPWGHLTVDPLDQAWAAPDPENVFIPLRGEATLDGDSVARAARDASDGGHAESVTVLVAGATDPPSVFPHLRTGDVFRWGPHRAAIVSVVPPDAILVGWVEVHLL